MCIFLLGHPHTDVLVSFTHESLLSDFITSHGFASHEETQTRWGFRGLPDNRAFVLPNAILANANGYVFALLKSA